jgi:hypothetical protein
MIAFLMVMSAVRLAAIEILITCAALSNRTRHGTDAFQEPARLDAFTPTPSLCASAPCQVGEFRAREVRAE